MVFLFLNDSCSTRSFPSFRRRTDLHALAGWLCGALCKYCMEDDGRALSHERAARLPTTDNHLLLFCPSPADNCFRKKFISTAIERHNYELFARPSCDRVNFIVSVLWRWLFKGGGE